LRGTTEVFFLKHRASKGFQEIYELPAICPRSQNLGIFKKLLHTVPTPKEETAADVLLKACGGGFKKVQFPFPERNSRPGNICSN